jgi:NCS1 family nucleobase:cation symporter-1
LSQAIFSPICGTLSTIIGIVCASAGSLYYPGALLWTPYQLLTAIQLGENTAGARAAVFFAALVFTCAQLSLNISGNLIAGGIDLATVAPKYINIRRGAYITLAVSVAMNPWALLNGSTAFINVMSGYSTFIGPITGIMVFDYFFVHNRKVKLSALYDGSPNSIYWYSHGCNWRVFISWIFGVAPLFPGFLESVGAGVIIPIGMTRLYYLCYPFGFLVSGMLHVIISKIYPPPGIGEVDEYDVFGTFGEPESATDRGDNEDAEKGLEKELTSVAVTPVI